MIVKAQEKDVFIPAGVEKCPKCGGHNLAWCLACFWCGADFIDDEPSPAQPQQTDAA